MTEVLDVFLNCIPVSKSNVSGWITFDCPACNDRRSRGGFLATASGGFRYHCFNGGCEYETQPTGWEPDKGLGGRPRRLLHLLGGSAKDLPVSLLMRASDAYTQSGDKSDEAKEHPVWNFPEMDLPEDCKDLTDLSDDDNQADVLEFVLNRLGTAVSDQLFLWTPKYKRSVIVPYVNFGKIVGWMSRTIDDKGFFQKCGSEYIFNQDTLINDGRKVIVHEGIFDAISTMGVSIRQGTPNSKQELLLNQCGRDIVVLPDFDRSGIGLIDVAERNGWYVSTPDWDKDVKDASEACARYGRLYTVHSIIENCHKNYMKARIKASSSGVIQSMYEL